MAAATITKAKVTFKTFRCAITKKITTIMIYNIFFQHFHECPNKKTNVEMVVTFSTTLLAAMILVF